MSIIISLIIGTRPNYIKAFPVYSELSKYFDVELLHTGQHYDSTVNEIFFEQLGMRKPYIQFTLTSKTECEQLTEIMTKLFTHYQTKRPNLIIVFGDVTSTLAGALVANKLRIKLAHVESGLRSFDITMPEENNRIIVDSISDYLFVTEQSGINNLKNENSRGNILFVGNTMIDTLVKFQKNSQNLIINNNDFIVVTIHRQSNVDNPDNLTKIVNILNKLSEKYNFIFPIHHRTKNKLNELSLIFNKNIHLTEPLGYLDFMKYVQQSKLVITDSGGIQEETTFLGIHCITLRDNTERPSTLVKNGGTSILSSLDNLEENVNKYYNKRVTTKIELWDGKASERIAEIIKNNILN